MPLNFLLAAVAAVGLTDGEGPAVAVAAPPAESPPAVIESQPTRVQRRRVELLAAVGAAVGGTSWTGDPLGYGSFTLGLRLFRILTPFGMARVGYGNVDERLLTFLSIGLQVGYPIRERAYPYVRLAFVHQHEESLAVVVEDPLSAVLGVGSAIRHRAGGTVALGCDFVLLRRPRGELLLGPEAMLAYLGYSSGPNLYGSVGVQFGGSLTVF